MSIWKEIKYAINSTLGTSYFRPLDDIVNRELKSSSSLVYKTVTTNSVETEGAGVTTTFPQSVKMFCNGSVSLKAHLNTLREPGALTLSCNVQHIDGTINKYSTDSFYDDNGYYTLLKNINISKGDVLTFSIRQNGNYGNTISALYIMATEVQSSLLSVY